MNILAIDTSCDETSVAITSGQKIMSNVLFSQAKLHSQYGGVYPSLAKREHLTKIKPTVSLALKRARINWKQIAAIAVTFGPGLAPALEVGINMAKELSVTYSLPLIPVDHLEGHIYSAFIQNQKGKPNRQIKFPLLALIVSGGHTQLVLMTKHINYQVLGQTLDDAAGEALDKAARLLGLGYPGGPIIERLAKNGDNQKYPLPIPMQRHSGLDFSFSGLKTAFKRVVYNLTESEKNQNLNHLCASFQQAVFTALLLKLRQAVTKHQPKLLVIGGGVADNKSLRQQIRTLFKKQLPIYFPTQKILNGDNAAMIGVVAHFKYQKGIFFKDPTKLDRLPRANLNYYMKNINNKS